IRCTAERDRRPVTAVVGRFEDLRRIGPEPSVGTDPARRIIKALFIVSGLRNERRRNPRLSAIARYFDLPFARSRIANDGPVRRTRKMDGTDRNTGTRKLAPAISAIERGIDLRCPGKPCRLVIDRIERVDRFAARDICRRAPTGIGAHGILADQNRRIDSELGIDIAQKVSEARPAVYSVELL